MHSLILLSDIVVFSLLLYKSCMRLLCGRSPRNTKKASTCMGFRRHSRISFFLGHYHRNNPGGMTWRAYRDGPAPPNRFPDLPGRGPPRPRPRLLQLRPRHSMTSLQPPCDSSPSKKVRVAIKGRVQGGFYRNWTIENATQLGLKGWVRNRRDGSVEALFSGKPKSVEEMQQRCRRGPPDAVVTGLEVFPSTDDPGTGFERRPTV